MEVIMNDKLLLTTLALAASFSLGAQAQLLPPPKPGDEQPRADATRQANRPAAPQTLPAGSRARGPGTQTEDDEYVGRKPKSLGDGPATAPKQPHGPLATPSAKAPLALAASPLAPPGHAAPRTLPGARTPVAGGQDETDAAWKRRK
jgi:hypothetical protein